MSTLQETLKASSGIDVKEMLENYSGKGNIRPSIDRLSYEMQDKKEEKVKSLSSNSLKIIMPSTHVECILRDYWSIVISKITNLRLQTIMYNKSSKARMLSSKYR